MRELIASFRPGFQIERPELGGDFIVIGKADDLSDVEPEVLAIFEIELHGSKRICAVAVGNESETFRELISEVLQSLPHGEDACTDAPVIRASVSEDGTLHGIHDEPDIAFDASHFDVGFICYTEKRGCCSFLLQKERKPLKYKR